jgi:N-methylhydantoinase B
VNAEGSSALWNPPLRGGSQVSGQDAEVDDFEIITFNSGGTGARPTKDGLDGIAFPSGVRTMPVEATENVAPVIFWRKELRPDSAGPGRTRGGFGQIMEIGAKKDAEFAVNAIFDRVANPPKGRFGGGLGAGGWVGLDDANGTVLRTKGFQVIPKGRHLVLLLPGGGGMGDPKERDPASGRARRGGWAGQRGRGEARLRHLARARCNSAQIDKELPPDSSLAGTFSAPRCMTRHP